MEIKIDNKSVEVAVNELIRLEIAKVLASKSEYVIGQIVSAAMSRKENSYDRQTLVEKTIDKAVAQAANDAVNEWLAEQRPAIKKRVVALLKSKHDGLVDLIAKGLVGAFGEGFKVSAYIQNSRD